MNDPENESLEPIEAEVIPPGALVPYEEPAQPEPEPRLQYRKTFRRLRVDFSDAETSELGRQLAIEARAASAAEDEKKEVTSAITARINAHRAKMNELSLSISIGYAMREIETRELHDFDHGTVTVSRVDTGEEIEHRLMTDAERQRELPFSA